MRLINPARRAANRAQSPRGLKVRTSRALTTTRQIPLCANNVADPRRHADDPAPRYRHTPDPDAIPWLLLKAVETEGPGIFHRVTYIQRLHTTGSLMPSYAGDFAGETVGVPYTAEYVFYRAHR